MLAGRLFLWPAAKRFQIMASPVLSRRQRVARSRIPNAPVTTSASRRADLHRRRSRAAPSKAGVDDERADARKGRRGRQTNPGGQVAFEPLSAKPESFEVVRREYLQRHAAGNGHSEGPRPSVSLRSTFFPRGGRAN